MSCPPLLARRASAPRSRGAHEDDPHDPTLWRGLALPPPDLCRRHGSSEIEGLTQALARLPRTRPRSARRGCLHLMKKREGALEPLLAALQQARPTSVPARRAATNSIRLTLRDLPRPAPRRPLALCGRGSCRPGALDAKPTILPGRFHVLAAACRRSKASAPRTSPSPPSAARGLTEGGIDEVVLARTPRSRPDPAHTSPNEWRPSPSGPSSHTACPVAASSTFSTRHAGPGRGAPHQSF